MGLNATFRWNRSAKKFTFIRYFFYFEDGLEEIVEDYKTISLRLEIESIGLDTLHQVSDKIPGETPYRAGFQPIASFDQNRLFTALHHYNDTYILQIVCNDRRYLSDPIQAWDGYYAATRLNRGHFFGDTCLFAVYLQRRGSKRFVEKAQSAATNIISKSKVYPYPDQRPTTVECGHLSHIADDHYLLLVPPDGTQAAAHFLSYQFPHLEIFRHKVAYYDADLHGSVDHVHNHIEEPFQPEGIWSILEKSEKDELRQRFDDLTRLRYILELSRTTCAHVMDNMEIATRDYERQAMDSGLFAHIRAVNQAKIEGGRYKLKRLQGTISEVSSDICALEGQMASLPEEPMGSDSVEKPERFVVGTHRVLAQLKNDDPQMWRHVNTVLYDLFQKEHDRVNLIRQLGGGVSGALTLLVTPISKDRPCAPMVVKVGKSLQELKGEMRNFQEVIAKRMKNHVGRIEKHSEVGNCFGIAYTAVGFGRQEETITLETFLRDKVQCYEKVELVLNETFKLLESLHDEPDRIKHPVRAEYRQILPSILKLEYQDYKNSSNNPKEIDLSHAEESQLYDLHGDVILKGVVHEVNLGAGELKLYSGPEQFLKVDVRNIPDGQLRDISKDEKATFGGSIVSTLSERLKGWVREAINKLRLADLDDLPGQETCDFNGCLSFPNPIHKNRQLYPDNARLEMAISIIHGDLNLGNVLLTPIGSEYQPWLIDWAKVREDAHTAFDFTKLETEIKTHLLADELNGLSFLGAMDKLRLVYGFEQGLGFGESSMPDVVQDNPTFKKLFRTILKIRQLAQNLCITEEEYLMSLMFYALSTLKFSNLTPLGKLIGFISSGVAAEELI